MNTIMKIAVINAYLTFIASNWYCLCSKMSSNYLGYLGSCGQKLTDISEKLVFALVSVVI